MADKWKEEAWEELLAQLWDKRNAGQTSIEYNKEDLEPILSKYTRSGQGEIRIFNSGSNKVSALKSRDVVKIPLSRDKWKIVKRPPSVHFSEPEGGEFPIQYPLTEGMHAGIVDSMLLKSNPGETTLLAIANHIGVVADFYELGDRGVLFTGGRQKAGIHLVLENSEIDMTKAQIEIDGGFEWPNTAVIVEMKSSFKQEDFDVNQALIPMLKWKELLKTKKVYSLVMFAETNARGIEYWAFDLEQDNSVSEIGMRISKSKKYIINI